MEKIKVMVVDDHVVVRTGLKALLNKQPDLEVIAEAENGAEAVEKAREAQPNVIIMDITMPVMDGIEATKRLMKERKDNFVVALTVHEDKQYLIQMMKAGASGYISKQARSEELVAAIQTAASGNIFLQPTQMRWLLEGYHAPAPKKGAAGAGMSDTDKAELNMLSKREIQVLELVAKGLTSSEIGEKLGISPKTIYRHRDRIKNKLKIRSNSELVLFSIRTGLVEV